MPCLTCGELVLWNTAFPWQSMLHFHEIYSRGFRDLRLILKTTTTFEPGNATKTERQSPVELRFVVPPDPGRPEFLQLPCNCCCSAFLSKQLPGQPPGRSKSCSLPVALRCPWSTFWQKWFLDLGRVHPQYTTVQRKSTTAKAVPTFGFSSHSTHWIVVKLPGLVVQVWCKFVYHSSCGRSFLGCSRGTSRTV